MTRELANRMMMQGARVGSFLPTAVLGSAVNMGAALELNKPRVRVGLWPIVSAEMPAAAMGLASVFAYLLELYQDTRIYRLFARVEGDPTDYDWGLADSQFDVDDWQLDDLDENAAVWGEITKRGQGWRITLFVENDLLGEEEDLKEFSAEGDSLNDLIHQLLDLADQVAAFLDVPDRRMFAVVYERAAHNDHALQSFLEKLFAWELKLYLSFWGKAWKDDEVQTDLEALMNAATGVGDFGAWAAARAAARVLRSADAAVMDRVAASTDMIAERMTRFDYPDILLANALLEVGRSSEAYDLLDSSVERHPASVRSRLALAELYRRGGRITEAIAAFQNAIEDDVVSVDLLMRYADFIEAMESFNIVMDEFVLIDPADYPMPDRMTWETLEAYDAALELDRDNLDALYQKLLKLLEINSGDEFWNDFKRIVDSDDTGERVRSLVESLYTVEDMGPAFRILRTAIDREPDRHDLYLNLAAAYLIDEQGEKAKAELKKAHSLTDDPAVHVDIEYLLLSADDPDFDMRLGEITDIVSAGGTIATEDVEFLEAALESAPSFAQGYVLLAKAYLAWKEPSSAIEVLLDGHKRIPDDPEILAILGATLWDSGERELAFSYLNKGVTKNPNDVPLLALTGRYLFEDGQEDAAKAYLARAGLIAPNHPALAEVRAFIARSVADD